MTAPLVFGLEGEHPVCAADAFVAPQVVLVGRVRLERGASVWYGSVLRGDEDDIVVGEETNVQDGCVLHADPGFPVILGRRVTVGHRAVVHGARVGSGSVIAAGAVVTSGTEIPQGSLVAGVPAKVVRPTGQPELDMIARGATSYVRRAARHRAALGALQEVGGRA